MPLLFTAPKLNEGVVAAAILAAVSPGFQPGGLDVEAMEAGSFLRSWRQDAAGYGRQDARRYGKRVLIAALNSQSRAEFQLSHKCIGRRMRLFVVEMGKTENCKLLGHLFKRKWEMFFQSVSARKSWPRSTRAATKTPS
jgi:hypothetical protein